MSPLSLVIPMLSFTPVFAVGSGALLIGEWPTRSQLLGIGLVSLGAAWLALAGGGSRGRGLREPGVWLMTLVALLWSCTIALDKLALRHADVPAHALGQALLIGTGLLLLLAGRGELRALRAIRPHMTTYAGAVGLQCVATALQLAAVTTVFVGVVEGLKRSIGLALALLNGWWWFGEPLTPAKLCATAVMAVGVLLLVV